MQARSRNHFLLLMLGFALILVLVVVSYLPVVLAWSDRHPLRDYPEFPDQEFVVVTPNAPMRWFSLVYDPLIRFHAKWNGWSSSGETRVHAFPEPEMVMPIFVRQKTPATE